MTEFAVVSDIHYVSRRMITDKSDKELMLQPSVSEQAVLQAARKSDVLLITGDLTASGDRYSHEDFAAFLRKVKESGTRIYVIFATHDFHHFKSYVRKSGEKVNFRSRPWDAPYFDKESVNWKDLATDEFSGLSEDECTPELVDVLCPDEIWKLYREFGPEQAYSVHPADYSYCIDLDDRTRCLMLNDIFRNEENLRDRSPTFSPDCFKWIKRMYDEAKRDGKYIFVCSHTPMVPAVPAHRIGASEGNRDLRSPVVGHTLADMGFNLAFTGHSHFCDVGYLKSEKGNVIHDITTPSVRFYPPAFRIINLDGQNGKVQYTCEYVEIPENEEIEEANLFDHYHNVFYNQYYNSIAGSNKHLKKFFDTKTVGDIYFLVRGKAKLSKEEHSRIKDVKLFDLIIETVFNMLIGDGKYTPDTAEYKILMSIGAKLDSIIDAQPFVDVKKKYLGGYSVSQILEPLLFNNYASDRNGEIDFTKEPHKTMDTPEYSSIAGGVIMTVIYILAVPLSVLAPAVVAIGIPAMALKKKKKAKKESQSPNLRYQY